MICQETFRSLNLDVQWEMKSDPEASAYPDYQWVDQAMEEFFKDNPIVYSKWSTLKPKLEEYLLKKYPSLSTIVVEVRWAE